MLIFTDIHGNYNTFMELLNKIPQSEKDKGIVVCGDLIDRGPKSKQVVQYIIDNNILCVRGNHENMMIDWVNDGCSLFDRNSLFLINGGSQTMNSYRFEDGDNKGEVDYELMKTHAKWMDSLPYYIEFPEIKNSDGRYLVISHSAVAQIWKHRNNPVFKDRFNETVTWGRWLYHDNSEIYNVFGHTPERDNPKLKSFYANIDTGCAYGPDNVLTCLQFPEMIVYQEKNIDFVGK